MSTVLRLNPDLYGNNNIDINSSPEFYIGTANYSNISGYYAISYYGYIEITITTKSGYKFDPNQPPELMLRNQYGNAISGVSGIPFTLDNTASVATLSGNINNLSIDHFTSSQFSGNRILDLYAYTIQTITPPNVTYTNNIQNATFNSVINTDNSVTVTISANNTYYFTNTPTISYINVNNETITENFVLNSDNTCGLKTFTPKSGNSSAILNGNTALIPTHTIINNVANSTYNASINNDIVELSLTASNQRYYFTTVPTVEYYESGTLKIGTFTINENNPQLAEITITADKDIINIYGVCQYAIPIETELSNAVLSGVDNYFVPYNQNILNLTITANNGFCLDTEPYIELWGLSIAGDKKYFILDTEEPIKTATLIYNIDTEYNINNIYSIVIHCFAVPLVAFDFGTINVYKVTKQNLNDFSLIRYGIHNDNLNNYVVSLKRLYFNVGETVADTLKCGNIDTNINVQSIIFDKVTINCGSIIIPLKNNDNLDYECELTLFIPFYGMYTLNNQFLGKEIFLKYIVSTLTGQGFAQIVYNDSVFVSVAVDTSDTLFYEKITDNANINQFTPNYLNGLQPYLLIKYYENENNHIYNADCIRAVLNTFNGYIECTEITNFNNSTITNEEKEMLYNELKNGVIIQ